MSNKFKLNAKLHRKNIFDEKNLTTDVIISRAFKPLPIIFEKLKNNFKNFKYIILFLGKSGKKILNDSRKSWRFDIEEKKSSTNDGSIIVKISNLKKKNWLENILIFKLVFQYKTYSNIEKIKFRIIGL